MRAQEGLVFVRVLGGWVSVSRQEGSVHARQLEGWVRVRAQEKGSVKVRVLGEQGWVRLKGMRWSGQIQAHKQGRSRQGGSRQGQGGGRRQRLWMPMAG